MANEIQVTASLVVNNGNLQYQSRPAAFTATMTGQKGPTPGALTALTTGTVVDLSELTTPGVCRLMNVDDTNFVTVGVYDGVSFFPLLELKPGESFPVRLSRYINQEFAGTGTGTGSDVNQLMVMADTASCVVLVEAFEN